MKSMGFCLKNNSARLKIPKNMYSKVAKNKEQSQSFPKHPKKLKTVQNLQRYYAKLKSSKTPKPNSIHRQQSFNSPYSGPPCHISSKSTGYPPTGHAENGRFGAEIPVLALLWTGEI